ncbi:MAG: nucleotidyltransferase domain-containing protein [Candidatus Woesearchaeota archaeon]
MAGSKKTTKKSANKKSASKKTSTSSKKASSRKAAKQGEPTELDKALEQVPADQKDKLENIKDVLESFKDKIIKRLEGYVMGVSLLPPDKDDDKKEKINALVLIDDSESRKLSKEELHEKLQKINDDIAETVDKNLKPQVLLLSEIWQQCYDGKYDVLQMIASGATVYDTGMLAAIKISEIHKNMVLKKFEKYIVSYVLGGSLVQGRATPDSDIDVFVIIDDTDVKKMTRTELRDKLRSIIVGMGMEAGQMTGIHNKINIQVYILTDFWENVKDANPVIFTFLRDGVPFYDRGTFMPWKQLLQMGRVKPSPEAIEMFRNSGSQFMDRINMKIRDIVMEDLFWAILTPSQAALMLYGIPPTTPKETPQVMRDVLVKQEKLLEGEYVKTLEDVLDIRKKFEHGTIKTISGKEMDDFVKRSESYLKRLDTLFNEIEDRKEEERVLHTYESVVTMVRDVLKLEDIEKVQDKDLAETFRNNIVQKGYIGERYHRLLVELFQAKKNYDNGKLTKQEVKKILKDSKDLTNTLLDHIQRKRGKELEKTRIKVKYGDSYGEVILLGEQAFIVHDIDKEEKSVTKAKITDSGTLIDKQESSLDELEDALMSVEIPPKVFVKSNLFDNLRNIFGDDVEILFNY